MLFLTLENSSVIVAIISAFGSAFLLYLKHLFVSKKSKKDSFEEIIEANKEYRDEIRKDLQSAKLEIENTRKELVESHKKIEVLNVEIKELKSLIAAATSASKFADERFNILANLLPVGIFRASITGECLFVNKKWIEIAGLSFEKALNNGWKNAIHPDDVDRVLNNWKNTIENHISFDMTYRFLKSDGTSTIVHGRALREEDYEGRLLGYVGYVVPSNVLIK
jgi:PAS domain S-box-containing protein